MAMAVRELLKLECFRRAITLVSDESGLDTMVTWPYIRQTDDISQWVNGGEIIFVFDKDESEEQQLELIRSGISCRVAAFVFLCGGNSIQQISPAAVEYAKEHHMSLFTMPYEVKLIDVTREIAVAIMQSENREHMALNFISDLLSGNYKDEEQIKKQGYECGIDMDKKYIALSIETTFDYSAKDYARIMSFRNNMLYVLKHLEQIGNNKNTLIVWKFHVVSAICFLIFDEVVNIDGVCREIDEFLKYHFSSSELNVYAGYSTVHTGISSALTAAHESENALTFARKSGNARFSYHYEELGILRILVNSNSREDLRNYCDHIFEDLIKSDRSDMTEYLVTVKTYLENNNNLSETSRKLFIHRNTLINRINKIEELTGKNLSDANVKLEYLCGFKLLEFLME